MLYPKLYMFTIKGYGQIQKIFSFVGYILAVF